jgi:hypothetical protein
VITYTIGDTVFLTFMRVPGTVLKVADYGPEAYGYIVEIADGHGTDLFRLDEVEDYDADLWEGE